MLGAHYLGSGKCIFNVWAPSSQSVSVKITTPDERDIALDAQEKGYWQTSVEDIKPGSRYYYRLNGQTDRPDPASNFQPEGIYGPSAVIDHNSFSWSDENWKPIALEKIIIYELHVSTFTPQGSFEAIIDRLDDLLELGVNTIELMPVAQFPGERNWGYDGVFPFAVQNSYGGPEGLKRLIDACHQCNLTVILDVVYNHLGPEGNILSEFGPYFTDKYKTPWGNAINFDGEYSDQVRNFFISNAIFWLQQYHIDALRLDALHAIYDTSAKPFIRELAK
jgi:maltooligosyltrehalose trehalohydrolase